MNCRFAGQAKALGISRGSVYYLARPTSDADLALMRRIDELHLEHPFAGSRMLRDILKAEGREIGRRHVATLMKKMGVEAIYRRPNTSKPAPGHKIYPYLLRNLAVSAAQPGLGERHHLRADGAGVRVSRRHRRSVQPQGPASRGSACCSLGAGGSTAASHPTPSSPTSTELSCARASWFRRHARRAWRDSAAWHHLGRGGHHRPRRGLWRPRHHRELRGERHAEPASAVRARTLGRWNRIVRPLRSLRMQLDVTRRHRRRQLDLDGLAVAPADPDPRIRRHEEEAAAIRDNRDPVLLAESVAQLVGHDRAAKTGLESHNVPLMLPTCQRTNSTVPTVALSACAHVLADTPGPLAVGTGLSGRREAASRRRPWPIRRVSMCCSNSPTAAARVWATAHPCRPSGRRA